MAHHIQARCSEDTRAAIEQLAKDRGVSASEIVRDIVESYVYSMQPGSTMAHPDQGYRIAKSTASVIARRILFEAYKALPETWEEFKRSMEKEGVDV